jgi:hypothetical protein
VKWSPTALKPVGRATWLVDASAGVMGAAVFGAASAIRGTRVFHPDGLSFDAHLAISGGHHGAEVLDRPAEHRCVVRLSRGAGLPEPWPDILGLAIRIVDAHGPGRHQDLLMVSSWSPPLARHLLLPVLGFEHRRWSAVLPHRVGKRTVVFGARACARTPRLRLDDLRAEAAAGRLVFWLELAAPCGTWEPVGVLTLEAPCPDDQGRLAFDPSTGGAGIAPVGVLQATRRLSYRASQAARSRMAHRRQSTADLSGGDTLAPEVSTTSGL